MSIDERIRALIDPLRSEHATLTKEKQELQVQMDLINEQLRRVEKVLRAADPETYAERKNGKREAPRVSEENIQKLLRIMWAEPHVTHTMGSLAEKTGLSDGTMHYAMAELRARGDVRSVGRIPNPKGKGPGVMGFRIGEHVVVEEKPKKKPTPHISPERLARMTEAARHIEGEFTTRDLERLTELPKSTVGFGVNQLLEQGVIVLSTDAPPGQAKRYRLSDA